MSEPHLVIAAFWSIETPDEATNRVAQSIAGHIIPGAGAVVSIKQADSKLFTWLRTVQCEEAADYGETRR